MNILKRLFIKLPLYIIWGGVTCTIVIPVIYWVITGDFERWVDLTEDIDDL